jgi:hypothetical protein
MIRTQASQLIQVPITDQSGTGAKVYFPNIGNLKVLQNKPITGIECYYSTIMPNSPIDGVAVATLSTIQRCSLTLNYEKGGSIVEWVYNQPLISLVACQSGTNPFRWSPIEYDNIIPSWEKCYIQAGAALYQGTPYNFVFNVFYQTDNVETNVNARLNRIEQFLNQAAGRK